MMNKNARCSVRRVLQHDVYGKQTLSGPIVEHCAIVKLRKELQHTTVRADSSQSRGYAEEFLSSNKVLMDSTTVAQVGDQVEVAGAKVRITSLGPSFDVTGRIDHYEMSGESWE